MNKAKELYDLMILKIENPEQLDDHLKSYMEVEKLDFDDDYQCKKIMDFLKYLQKRLDESDDGVIIVMTGKMSYKGSWGILYDE